MVNLKLTSYERIAENLLKHQSKAKPCGRLVGKKFLTGTQSLHLTVPSRTWRLFWRLKYNRILGE